MCLHTIKNALQNIAKYMTVVCIHFIYEKNINTKAGQKMRLC